MTPFNLKELVRLSSLGLFAISLGVLHFLVSLIGSSLDFRVFSLILCSRYLQIDWGQPEATIQYKGLSWLLGHE